MTCGRDYVARAGSPDLGPKWVRLAPNWTNMDIFFRSDSVHFGSLSQNVLNLIWKKSPDLSHFGPFWPTLCPNLPPVSPPLVSRDEFLSEGAVTSDSTDRHTSRRGGVGIISDSTHQHSRYTRYAHRKSQGWWQSQNCQVYTQANLINSEYWTISVTSPFSLISINQHLFVLLSLKVDDFLDLSIL